MGPTYCTGANQCYELRKVDQAHGTNSKESLRMQMRLRLVSAQASIAGWRSSLATYYHRRLRLTHVWRRLRGEVNRHRDSRIVLQADGARDVRYRLRHARDTREGKEKRMEEEQISDEGQKTRTKNRQGRGDK